MLKIKIVAPDLELKLLYYTNIYGSIINSGFGSVTSRSKSFGYGSTKNAIKLSMAKQKIINNDSDIRISDSRRHIVKTVP